MDENALFQFATKLICKNQVCMILVLLMAIPIFIGKSYAAGSWDVVFSIIGLIGIRYLIKVVLKIYLMTIVFRFVLHIVITALHPNTILDVWVPITLVIYVASVLFCVLIIKMIDQNRSEIIRRILVRKGVYKN